MCLIIDNIDAICHAVGRPKNNVIHCKVCGIELSFFNCDETKKGSGSLKI